MEPAGLEPVDLLHAIASAHPEPGLGPHGRAVVWLRARPSLRCSEHSRHAEKHRRKIAGWASANASQRFVRALFGGSFSTGDWTTTKTEASAVRVSRVDRLTPSLSGPPRS